MAKAGFRSVDEYIAAQTEAARDVLRQVRNTIRKALPAAEEVISYGIPTYRLPEGPALYFAGWKKHFSLYPASQALIAGFKGDLNSYVHSKGTLRFPLSEPVPIKIVERVAKFRARELREEAGTKASRKK